MEKSTAILLFAQSASKEAEAKSGLAKKTFFQHCTSAIVKKISKVGVPYVIITEEEQQGDTFGERFSNAISAVYKQGFSHVVVVGNDTPHLTIDHLKKAISATENEELVLGRATDGGFYLLGVSQEQFVSVPFHKFSYQKRSVAKEILSIFGIKQGTQSLPYLQDIDSAEDVKKVLSKSFCLAKKFLNILLSLVVKKIASFLLVLCYFGIQLKNNFYNKGQPVYS